MALRWLFLASAVITASAHAQTAPASAPPAGAQSPAAQAVEPTGEEEEDYGPDIQVTGQREPGAVPGDVKPELQLNPADIRSYGVSSVAELLNELGPQVRSDAGRGGGAPVILLNGRRISGFGEIRDLPTEAIVRVDILPEEASLALGYRPDQRVVNFVLRPRFRAYTGELQGGGSTGGDRYSAQADLNRLTIRRDRRFSVNLHYEGATPVYESDRDIIQSDPIRPYGINGNLVAANGAAELDPLLSTRIGRAIGIAGVPDAPQGPLTYSALLLDPANSRVGQYRTLSAATRTYSTNMTYARTVFGNVTGSINGSLSSTASNSALGLSTLAYTVPVGNPYSPFSNAVTDLRYLAEAGARGRDVDGLSGHVGSTLNGDVGKWRWAITGNFDRAFSRTLTDTSVDFSGLSTRILANDPTLNPFGRFDGQIGGLRQDYARSLTTTGGAELTASGPLLKLPAGNLVTSLKTAFETSDLNARAVRSGIGTSSDLGRRTGTMQASIDIPIASKRAGVLSALGTLSLNGNFTYDNLSDFGGLRTYGYGLNWSPITPIRLIASVTQEEGPPSIAQLGNPVVITPDARVFDFIRGETVQVTQVDGGNTTLRSDDRRRIKLGLTAKPFTDHDVTLTANYVKSRILDPIASFPSPTAAIEAAFPERFTRDGAGNLIRVDARPVNFTRRDSEELRWGFNFSTRIGPKPPARPPGGFRGGFGQRRPQVPVATPPTGEPTPTAPTSAAGSEETRTPQDGAANARPNGAPSEGGAFAGGGQRGPGGFGGPGGQGGGFGGRGGFGGGGGGFGGGGGRLQFALYHTWHMQESIQVRPGVPEIDLLDGSAITSRGGQPRHELELQAGGTLNGYGVRLSGNWQSGTSINAGTANAATNLKFSSLATINLRLFTNFQPNMKFVREHRWLRGTRVTLSVQNLFDTRLRVTDPTGGTPINYQPDLLDPIGRTVRIGLRKLFF